MPFEQSSNTSSEAIVKLKERLSGFETEEGRISGLDYRPKSSEEILITTTPKAGTKHVRTYSSMPSCLLNTLLTFTFVCRNDMDAAGARYCPSCVVKG